MNNASRHLLEDNAAVACTPTGSSVARNWMQVAQSDRLQPRRRNSAIADEKRLHGQGSALGQLQVVVHAADYVSVTLNSKLDLRIVLQVLRQTAQYVAGRILKRC